jgi:peptide-methionine (S)-S-oxide reductase
MVANRGRLTLGSGLGALGVAAAVFIGVQSGVITSPAVLAGIGTASPVVVPAPKVDEPQAAPGSTETAVLAGGCFWGVQGVFRCASATTRPR